MGKNTNEILVHINSRKKNYILHNFCGKKNQNFSRIYFKKKFLTNSNM